MATEYKVLGQVAPSAATLTDLFTVPALSSAVCSTLTICNRGAAASFRIAVRPDGDVVEDKHYIVFDGAVAANDSVFLTIGVTISAGDVVSVYSVTDDISFSLFGSVSS